MFFPLQNKIKTTIDCILKISKMVFSQRQMYLLSATCLCILWCVVRFVYWKQFGIPISSNSRYWSSSSKTQGKDYDIPFITYVGVAGYIFLACLLLFFCFSNFLFPYISNISNITNIITKDGNNNDEETKIYWDEFIIIIWRILSTIVLLLLLFNFVAMWMLDYFYESKNFWFAIKEYFQYRPEYLVTRLVISFGICVLSYII